MKPIENGVLWKIILKTERLILVITSVLSVLVITAGVFLRYVLKTDLFGIEEIMTVVAMWLYWIGGVYGSYEDSHIKADISKMVIKSAGGQKALNVLIYGITMLGLCVFTKWGLDYAAWNIAQAGKTPGLNIPLIVSQIPITIGFLMMFLYSTYHLVRTLVPRKGAKEVEA